MTNPFNRSPIRLMLLTVVSSVIAGGLSGAVAVKLMSRSNESSNYPNSSIQQNPTSPSGVNPASDGALAKVEPQSVPEEQQKPLPHASPAPATEAEHKAEPEGKIRAVLREHEPFEQPDLPPRQPTPAAFVAPVVPDDVTPFQTGLVPSVPEAPKQHGNRPDPVVVPVIAQEQHEQK